MSHKVNSKTKWCWFCKGKMQAKKDYFQCTECGATWNDVVQPHLPVCTLHEVTDPVYGDVVVFDPRLT